MSTKAYQDIENKLINKYMNVFLSLYNFDNEVLDENLLKELFYRPFVIIQKETSGGIFGKIFKKGELVIKTGYAIENGFDNYGNVFRGQARYLDQRFDPSVVKFNEKNSVVIYANRERQSVLSSIYEDLTEIASIFYGKGNNLRLSNIKSTITAKPSTATTMKQVLNEYLDITKSHIVVQDETIEKPTIMDLGVDYIPEKYQGDIMFHHNQILERLGVNFTPYEKKERLVADEVNSNNEIISNIKKLNVKRMTRYMEKIKEVLSVDVKFTVNEKETKEETNKGNPEGNPEDKKDEVTE